MPIGLSYISVVQSICMNILEIVGVNQAGLDVDFFSMAQAYTILRSDCKSSSAAPVESVSSQLPCDLISFLAVAQAMGIDVLALTWHPELEPVGHGGTSNIQELLVKSRSSFAFKRFEYSNHTERDEKIIFRGLIAEISVLGHRALRAHPNIQPMLGVCWDMRADGRVWPVLVSRKSNFGNLDEYMDSVEGQSLSFASRLEICAGVALAIRDMHSCRKAKSGASYIVLELIHHRYCPWRCKAFQRPHR